MVVKCLPRIAYVRMYLARRQEDNGLSRGRRMKKRAVRASLSALRKLLVARATASEQNTLKRPSDVPGSPFISNPPFSSSAAGLRAQCVNSPKLTGRKRLVVLGTGWGGYSVVRKADKKLFDVIVISPRNHFLFTPLLASTTVGTLEFRSIIEPIRNAGFRDEHHFHQSRATGLDLDKQVVRCVSALDPELRYDVGYDVLVIAVGAVPNDFNIPGVKEHAFFLKVQIMHFIFIMIMLPIL